MIGRAIDRDRLAQRVSRSDEKGRFEFVIEAAAGSESRGGCIRRLDLAVRPANVRAAHDDGAGAAVISDRKPFPIWHERVFRTAQHRADVVGVVIRRIKIRVITDARRQLHRDIFLRVKSRPRNAASSRKVAVSAASKCWSTSRALRQAGRPSARKAFRAFSENTRRFWNSGESEMPELLENRKIEHELADRDTHARRTLRRLENSEGKILDRKMRIGRDFDERFERSRHGLKPSHK